MIDIMHPGSELPVAVYCPPQPPGPDVENRIHEKSFRLLAECGVNTIFCMHEAFGGMWEGFGYRALDLCAKYDMAYLAQDSLLIEFICFDGCKRDAKPFGRLSAAEKRSLKERYLRSLEKYMGHPACAGTIFFDEPGLKSLDGIGYAREIFKSRYPDKTFYINNFSYALNETIMLYGIMLPAIDEPENKIPQIPPFTHENRLVCYEYYMRNMLEKVNPDILSFDLYPVQQLGGAKHCFHKGFFEMATMYSLKARALGKPFWNYIQCGSWSEVEQYPVGYAEAALQIYSSLALGARGIVFFPGCYPNDWLMLGSPAERTDPCGLLDRYGEVTNNYFMFRDILGQVKKISPYLLAGEYRGAALYGKLPQILPPENTLYGADYTNCNYFGEDFLGELTYRDGAVKKVTGNSQFLIGVSESGSQKALLAVNMSNLAAANLTLELDKKYAATVIADKNTFTVQAERICIPYIGAGEAALIVLNQ